MTDRQDEFAEVYRRHRLRWVRLAYAVAGHPRHAEEAVAEAVAHVWPRFRDGRVDDVASYMRRAVINEAVRQGQRHDRVDALARRSPRPQASAVDDTVEKHHLVMDGLARLPADQRATLALRYLEDLTEADTAALLGVRLGTVKSRLHRGLQVLRGVMEEVGVDGR